MSYIIWQKVKDKSDILHFILKKKTKTNIQ